MTNNQKALRVWVIDKYAFTQILLMKAAERIHLMVSAIHREWIEGANFVCALANLLPICFNRDYLAQHPYLNPIMPYCSVFALSLIFATLAIYWFFTMVFGGPPSALINHEGHIRGWTIARITGNIIGCTTWAAMAVLCTRDGLNEFTVLYAAASLVNGYMSALTAKTCVESQMRLFLEMERGRKRPRRVTA